MKKMLVFLVLSFFLLSSPGSAADYIVGAGDGLSVSVWGSPDLSGETLVRPDGKITLPAVGDVTAAGLTLDELRTALREALKSVVREPVVTVAVTTITNNKVFISGMGTGVIQMGAPMTLYQLLCQVEGVANADLTNAFLSRDGKKIVTDFHPLFARGEMDRDVPLQANDVIHIPTNEMNKIYVLGAVNGPRYVLHRPGMKLLDVVLDAGGFSDYAKLSGI
ncbi:MAG: polysaccharide biosynthesis/export family protein, partial [Deltaproteobacteria bacterium]|nr:polysaccharide biosynthesis/export family protein [Candidatus Anaeroferrophillacea bacterium]